MRQSYLWYSKAIGINDRLRNKCSELDINFVDLWDLFYGRKEFFNSDGVHLNRIGKKALAEKLRGQFKFISSIQN